jgi:hypothetical protein
MSQRLVSWHHVILVTGPDHPVPNTARTHLRHSYAKLGAHAHDHQFYVMPAH